MPCFCLFVLFVRLLPTLRQKISQRIFKILPQMHLRTRKNLVHFESNLHPDRNPGFFRFFNTAR